MAWVIKGQVLMLHRKADPVSLVHASKIQWSKVLRHDNAVVEFCIDESSLRLTFFGWSRGRKLTDVLFNSCSSICWQQCDFKCMRAAI